jgi:hypothetical protein
MGAGVVANRSANDREVGFRETEVRNLKRLFLADMPAAAICLEEPIAKLGVGDRVLGTLGRHHDQLTSDELVRLVVAQHARLHHPQNLVDGETAHFEV